MRFTTITISIPNLAIPALPHVNVAALARALGPFVTPALVVAAEAAGLGPFAPAVVGLVVKAVGVTLSDD
jgi:hypothetical protein